MATLTCTNKGCYKTTSDSLLDTTTDEIMCAECGKPIAGISPFTKRSMIGLGKVRSKHTEKAYSVECKKCTRVGQPKEDENGKYVCFHCGEELNITPYFIKMLKEHNTKK